MKIVKTFLAVLFALVFVADAQATIDLSEEADLLEKYNAIVKESNDADGMV